MSKESTLKFYLKRSYNEPRHPEDVITKFAWDSGIDMTIDGPVLMFDADTTLNQWRASEIKKWEKLMKTFKKDKEVTMLDFIFIHNDSDIIKTETKNTFIKWV